MNWEKLTSTAEFNKAVEASTENPVVILKHSTRCGMCTSVKSLLDSASYPHNIKFFIILVWENREVSDYVEEQTGVLHESPQLFLYHQKKLIYHCSHRVIRPEVILENFEQTV